MVMKTVTILLISFLFVSCSTLSKKPVETIKESPIYLTLVVNNNLKIFKMCKGVVAEESTGLVEEIKNRATDGDMNFAKATLKPNEDTYLFALRSQEDMDNIDRCLGMEKELEQKGFKGIP